MGRLVGTVKKGLYIVKTIRGGYQYLCKCTKCELEFIRSSGSVSEGKIKCPNCKGTERDNPSKILEPIAPISKEVEDFAPGERFGPFEFVGKVHKSNRYWYAVRCVECGHEVLKPSKKTLKRSKFCIICANKKAGDKRLKGIWHKMVRRCSNPADVCFKNYGARGITVCKEWKESQSAFIQWALNNGYNFLTSLDRIDVNKGYCPNNCRWVDCKTQNRNKRSNVYINFRGERICVGELAERTGLPDQLIRLRINRGWSVERAVYDSPNFSF